MCGINGILKSDKFGGIPNISLVERMNNQIIHRGPDGQGVYSDNEGVALGMRRLAIIDLHTGDQPIYSEDRTKVIVFNGEIYNYKDIRAALKDKGVHFNTQSDTEVILKGYEEYGIEIVNKLNGMFAFAIHDLLANKVVIARDRMGEKPLYFMSNSEFFVFASELKSIVKILPDITNEKLTISKTALNLYFSLTFIPAPYSIYENIHKLLPGNYIEINTEDLTTKTTTYWDIPNKEESNKITDFKLAKSKVQELLYDAVKMRMISDVPLGSFLSGGVDSSIITAIMADLDPQNKVNTFSIVSNNKNFDESARSNSVAKHIKSNHHSILLDFEELKDTYEKVLSNYDEPFADSSALPSYYVAMKTKNAVTVALTGDGGDEVFGGYNRYFMPSIGNKYRKFIPNAFHNSIIKPLINSIPLREDKRDGLFRYKKIINGIGATEFEDMINIMSLGFLPQEKECLLNSGYQVGLNDVYFRGQYDKASNLNSLNKSRYLDKNISLEGDMLAKVDRASMLTSLECRPPLLDHRLMELSYQLPKAFLINKGNTKYILKESFKHLLPEGLFDLPKSGFGIPVGNWLRTDLKEDLIALTNPELLKDQDLLNIDYVSQLVKEHLSSQRDHTFKLWTIFCFQKWWIKENKQS
jgi:asparagine synthase (glutamine-hydrolysing)